LSRKVQYENALGDRAGQRRQGHRAIPIKGTELRSIWRHFISPRGLCLGGQTLDALVNTATRFSAAIEQQLAILENDPAPADFAQNTIEYATEQIAYFIVLVRRDAGTDQHVAKNLGRPALFKAAFSVRRRKRHLLDYSRLSSRSNRRRM
jgi:hypothetical protein